MFSWTLLYLISEWVIRLVMLPVVTQRRRPDSAVAWLMVIFFFPWAGLVLYLLIGENRLPQRRISRHGKLMGKLRALGKRYERHPQMVRPELGPEAMAAVTLAERLGYMPILGGNAAELMSDSNEVIDRLIADIDRATDHVHLLFYIYANDQTGRRVAEALYRAIERGVVCRVLVDASSFRPMLKTLATEMVAHGVQLHPMLPVNLFRRRMARMDLRNHRKLAIVDGRIAYTGSQNIVNADYGHKDLAWHDMMVRLVGPVTVELQAVFVADWYFETQEILDHKDFFPEPEIAGSIPVQTLPSGPSYPTENYHRMVLAALHAAHRQVVITTPYFVPDQALLQAIQVAVLRGVEVVLVVPERCDQILVGAAGRAYYRDLLENGAKLFRYTKGLLHAKTVTIDDGFALLGSSNFDIRSFALNFELNLLLYGEQITTELRSKQQTYIAASQRLSLREWSQRPAYVKLVENIARLFSPLL